MGRGREDRGNRERGLGAPDKGRGVREKDENIGVRGVRWGLEARGRGCRISGVGRRGCGLETDEGLGNGG